MCGRIACGRDCLNAASYIRLHGRIHRIDPRPKDARLSELSLTLARTVGSPTISDMRRSALSVIILILHLARHMHD